jgi:hypothetical protein
VGKDKKISYLILSYLIWVKKTLGEKGLNRREGKGGAKKDKGREGGGKMRKKWEEKAEEKER